MNHFLDINDATGDLYKRLREIIKASVEYEFAYDSIMEGYSICQGYSLTERVKENMIRLLDLWSEDIKKELGSTANRRIHIDRKISGFKALLASDIRVSIIMHKLSHE